ncbi:MAG TPA: JAB domain-containing protein [Anaerolineae bacterium]|nr:JAB domain-containing protein [Anaerolineae bacterium]
MGDRHTSYRITDLASADRPRERLAMHGATALSNAELIAILLRSGIEGKNALQMAQTLILQFGGLTGLHRASYEEICAFRGIGPAKASQLKAAIELGNRFAIATPDEQPIIQSPEDAASLLLYEMGALEQEHLRVLLLDTRNRLMRIVEVYHGSLNSSLVRIGEVLREAVRSNAAAVIVAHNHHSGDPTPSPEDVALTRSIVDAGKLLDIEVLDHLVIGKARFVSLKTRGLGFE